MGEHVGVWVRAGAAGLWVGVWPGGGCRVASRCTPESCLPGPGQHCLGHAELIEVGQFQHCAHVCVCGGAFYHNLDG